MAEGAGSREQFLPAQYQPALPLDRLILKDGSPGAGDRMELDVLIVGAGPAGVARAVQLGPLAQSAHPPRRHRGVQKEGGPGGAPRSGPRVVGVRTAASGLDRDGRPLATYLAPNDLAAKVTVLAEGTRGMLSQAWCTWQQVTAANPQLFALGVKELWETRHPLDRIIHTLGWPLPRDAFGGSFMYPLAPHLVALGLVVGLDYRDGALDVHSRSEERRVGEECR